MRVLVTGAAGFIGFHLSRALLARGDEVTGLDNLNDYYDVELKNARLALLGALPGFSFLREDIGNRDAVRALIGRGGFDAVVHLAAQAGVRYSLTHPEAYVESNLAGFFHVLDACKDASCPHFVYASSSSVYGANEQMPFSEGDKADRPVSLYAATKKSGELLAHSYSHMYHMPATGVRFFTVYGPYGRPDMALFKFTRAILAGEPIDLYNHGDMKRDFTYVDDVARGILALLGKSAALRGGQEPHAVYNMGNRDPVALLDFVRAIEEETGRRAVVRLLPMQAGDVPATWADTSKLLADTGFSPSTPIREGVAAFVRWYREFYGV